ncbi:MarR family transcriptional regulator [Pedobacter yonginense]|uniref:MarR family transcriptional regulator n=1 Tax=Pedobacter yonginense TaxID=651869 RepID=A0A317EJ41_9SPHI|nr:MarR family winged helix-turn-helix transcriptional regulator [Pedobacter yonginense]PWS26119.1 MarR family transcriptional regulator [Pedobacter yonginense]
MNKELINNIRKLIQNYAYTSLQMHETIAKKAGLSGTDSKYLGFFIEKGKMTAGELATITGLTTGATTGLIDRFEKRELVKRQFEKNDRRKVVIVPDIEKIMLLFQPLYQEFRIESEKLITSFSEDEVKVIETYFLKSIEISKRVIGNINRG